MVHATSHNLQQVVQGFLKEFPSQIEPALPELSGAPPYSPDDSVRYGVIVVENKDGQKELTVRTSYLTESIAEIAQDSLFYVVPVLQIEDPESHDAQRRGRYHVKCTGWKIEEGKQGDAVSKQEIYKLLQNSL